jgi:aspartate aminotransferase-like enzyme
LDDIPGAQRMTSDNLPYRLRLPGPTAVPERVRLAMARPVVNHRGPEFAACLDDITRALQPIMGTSNAPLLFAASGTGMMEASLFNVLVPDDRLLVISNGQFAERFTAIANALGYPTDAIEVPWGSAVDPALLEKRLAAASYRAVVAVHNESSTGAVADLAAIGKIVRETPALLVVDAISSLGGIDMRQDEWGVDVLIAASQKALMCPPGIGIASISPKAWQVIDGDRAKPRFYWDFRRARDSAAKTQTAFTPAVTLAEGLRESLRMISEEGVGAVLARHHRLSGALKQGAATLGLTEFPTAPIKSNTVAVFNVPERADGGTIVKHLYQRYRTVIAGARNRLDGKVIRFGTMGYLGEADILLDLFYLERTLDDLGVPVKHGAALAAAAEALKA